MQEHQIYHFSCEAFAAYLVLGLDPGSYHRALICGDLNEAALRAHPALTWVSISRTVTWVKQHFPPESVGSPEKAQAWVDLSQDEREAILYDFGLITTAEEAHVEELFDILKR